MLDFRCERGAVRPAHFLKERNPADAIDELHLDNVLQAEFDGLITLNVEPVCDANVLRTQVLEHYAGFVQLAKLIK